MSIHYNKSCTKVDDVRCLVPTNTKWNTTQPRLVIQGYCESVEIIEENNRKIAIIK